jgi:hypothetical protein
LLLDKLRNKPFWIADAAVHRKKYREAKENNNDDYCCFWHAFMPRKHNIPQPCFDFEQDIITLLEGKVEEGGVRYLAILKSVGLGISTLCLYWIIWRCVRDSLWDDKTVSIIVGPNLNLALKMISRIRSMFEDYRNIQIESKASQITIKNTVIEAFPSNHLSSFRSLEKPICTYISEADFFERSQSTEVLHCSERYIPKAGKEYYILMESTANRPDNLMDIIFREEKSLYTRLNLPYLVGLNRMYSNSEVQLARQSSSFSREMENKFLGQVGNVFTPQSIEAAVSRGENYNPDEIDYSTRKILSCDPGWGSSAFGLCLAQMKNKQIQILQAEEYRVDYESMLSIVWDVLMRYGKTVSKIYVDGANANFIKSLKIKIGEDENYSEVIADCRKSHRNYEYDMTVVPVNFSEGRDMLANCKMLMERDGGHISINKKFNKLITSLRTSVENGEGVLDKEATSYDDIFDSFRMAMRFFFFRDKYETERKYADVQSFEFQRRFSK